MGSFHNILFYRNTNILKKEVPEPEQPAFFLIKYFSSFAAW